MSEREPQRLVGAAKPHNNNFMNHQLWSNTWAQYTPIHFFSPEASVRM